MSEGSNYVALLWAPNLRYAKKFWRSPKHRCRYLAAAAVFMCLTRTVYQVSGVRCPVGVRCQQVSCQVSAGVRCQVHRCLGERHLTSCSCQLPERRACHQTTNHFLLFKGARINLARALATRPCLPGGDALLHPD